MEVDVAVLVGRPITAVAVLEGVGVTTGGCVVKAGSAVEVAVGAGVDVSKYCAFIKILLIEGKYKDREPREDKGVLSTGPESWLRATVPGRKTQKVINPKMERKNLYFISITIKNPAKFNLSLS